MPLLENFEALGWSHRGETIVSCVIIPRDFTMLIGMCVPTDDLERVKSTNYYHYLWSN